MRHEHQHKTAKLFYYPHVLYGNHEWCCIYIYAQFVYFNIYYVLYIVHIISSTIISPTNNYQERIISK